MGTPKKMHSFTVFNPPCVMASDAFFKISSCGASLTSRAFGGTEWKSSARS